DGLNSLVRERHREHFRPSLDERPNRFVWLGTSRPFPAFTFYFKHDAHGLWRVHAYQYHPGGEDAAPHVVHEGRSDARGEPRSTFIVEAREETWRAAGLDRASEADTLAFCESLFAEELQGH